MKHALEHQTQQQNGVRNSMWLMGWAHLNPNVEFSSYTRGQRTIDHMLISRGLVWHCNTQCERFGSRLKGDQFCIDRSFSGNMTPITRCEVFPESLGRKLQNGTLVMEFGGLGGKLWNGKVGSWGLCGAVFKNGFGGLYVYDHMEFSKMVFDNFLLLVDSCMLI